MHYTEDDVRRIHVGDPASAQGKLAPILENPVLFGLNLKDAGLAGKVEQMFTEMLAAPGAVRATLKKYLG